MASSRKRSYHQSSGTEIEAIREKETKNVESTTTEKTPSARAPKRKKQKKLSNQKEIDSPVVDASKKKKKPLAGMTISVSTLSDNTKSSSQSESSSYNAVCSLCKELGASVIDLVCKRVNLLVCSEAAVKQATQRVRKAIKRSKPLVSVEWLERCKEDGRKVDLEEYRLDDQARDAIQRREDRLQTAAEAIKDSYTDGDIETLPDSGWTEPQDLGCCCVCHENGTEADCPWCKESPCNPNRV
mmetsp:Transcript_568/g.1170  ORF Transcript_568/g.1170 Transcript_568/m.1170 type:complete len:242 (-) Transcript_568:19-744(-)